LRARVLPIAGVFQSVRVPRVPPSSTLKCILDSDAHTFVYSVDGGAPAVVFGGLPAGRLLFPAVFVPAACGVVRGLENYAALHVGSVVRMRVMCQSGRARAVAGARGDIVAWLCERAPLWVVVRVCALLNDY
jgi:hypothetical protein